MRRFFIFILIIFSGNLSAGVLLKFDSYSARSYGLAETGVAFKGDINSSAINPANISELKYTTIGSFYLPWYASMSIFSFFTGTPINIKKTYYGSFALNFLLFSTGEFPNYDKNGNKLPDAGASDLILNLSYSYPLVKLFNMGINIKYISSKLESFSSDTLGFDFGILKSFNLPSISKDKLKNFDLGLSVQNLGFSQKYVSSYISLPLKIRTGINYKFYYSEKFDASLIMEMIKSTDTPFSFSIASELFLLHYYKLRFGYRFSSVSLHNTSIGIGINDEQKNYNMKFDYSYIPLGDMGVKHSFSINFEIKNIPTVSTNTNVSVNTNEKKAQ